MEKTISTLETEIISFVNDLPFWGKFLSEKILQGTRIDEPALNQAYVYLLEDLGLSLKTERPVINLTVHMANLNAYKTDVYLSKLANVEGVNALSENQILQFSPGLTIIFGNNGCGKSGYTRLFKKVFYSKTPEDILPNIYKPGVNKPTKAWFTFSSVVGDEMLEYPANASNVDFRQFAVFDGKSVLKHIENRNQFEFRPSGLAYFGSYTDCIKRMEALLDAEIQKRQSINNLADLFDGESEIKVSITGLSAKTDLKVLKKYLPFSDEDRDKKNIIQKEHDDLLLASKGKEKERTNLSKIRQQLESAKNIVINLNRFFTDEHLMQVTKAITDCLEKEGLAQKEGIANFAVSSIKQIGSPEWKEFIVSAQKFAEQQEENYPNTDDSCILCNQPLSDDARTLIKNYWSFIKSEAEKEAKLAQQGIDKGVAAFDKLNFTVFPDDSSLTDWLTENHPKTLAEFNDELTKLKVTSELIVQSLREKSPNAGIKSLQIPVTKFDSLIQFVDDKIKVLSENAEIKKLQDLKQQIDFYTHKEKLGLHFEKIEKLVENQRWVVKAGKASWGKRGVTDHEKSLSAKYFNQRYIDTFNDECKQLNGNFGIVINHTGTAGTSYKQLFIEGKIPSAILSEGEQNVIGLSDFLAEMDMSEINRGIIFDDPVTSLDHERKETIAKRLVEIAATKQLIVLTHDIFFVFSLKNNAEAKSLPYISTSLFKIDDAIGMTKPTMPWIASNVKDRCGYLKNELQTLTKLAKTADPDDFRFEVKKWCGLLREAWERSVEERLFKGVVTRFTPGIETQKLKYLNITKELIDDINEGMTKTSQWIHDQAGGVNTPTPTPAEMEEMIKNFETFITTKCKVQ